MNRNFPESDNKLLPGLLRRRDPDAWLYMLGLIIMPLFALLWHIAGRLGLLPGFCLFRSLTGIYCPGCGATRAFHMLLRLDIKTSLIYNPVVLYSVALGLIFYVSQTLRFISRGRLPGLHISPLSPLAGAGLLLVNWLVKNTLLLFCGISLIN